MGLFTKKAKTPEVHRGMLPEISTAVGFKPLTTYIEIYESKKGRCHIRVKGGNNKIRFHSENYYSKRNARRAALLFSNETGFKIVDRTK